jgi:two-component system nitrogen regulation sensor histidine kinase GlnL
MKKHMLAETTISPLTQRRILESQNTAIVLLDDEMHVLYINPACEMLFAISARKANGMRLDEIIIEPVTILDRIRASTQTYHPFSERELQLLLPGERNLTVDCTVTPLDDPQQENGLLLELIPMDRHIRIAKEENLIAQNHATQGLLRGLAHEIKNPLGGLRGAAQLLERELPDPELKEYTQVIIAEADRLQNLVNRMLGPNSLPNKQLINIHSVIQRVCTLVKAEVNSGVTIKPDFDPSIPELEADPDQLIQVILNLVRNAVQALDIRGEIILRTRTRRQITIANVRHKLVAMIEVIDNGPGIPKEMVEEIFFPMITGRAEGTGLGLTIAQSLINRHGGLIECSSKPGKTIFRIMLPLETGND